MVLTCIIRFIRLTYIINYSIIVSDMGNNEDDDSNETAVNSSHSNETTISYSDSNETHVSSSQEFKCPHCQKIFQHKSSFSCHKSTKCGTVKGFQCSNCHTQYDRKDTLTRHIKNGCKGEKKNLHICATCSKDFITPWHLQ